MFRDVAQQPAGSLWVRELQSTAKESHYHIYVYTSGIQNLPPFKWSRSALRGNEYPWSIQQNQTSMLSRNAICIQGTLLGSKGANALKSLASSFGE